MVGASVVVGGASVRVGVSVGTSSSPTPSRSGNGSTSTPSNVGFMKSSQMLAGMVDPSGASDSSFESDTLELPSLVGLYVPTDTAIWGTKPLNHFERFSSDVPVLAATGRSNSRPIFVAVPSGFVVYVIASVTSAVTSLAKARRVLGLAV